jgi:signal peptidase I
MLKKIILTIINVISVFIIVCAVFVLLTVLFTGSGQAPSILGHSMFRVMTGSMEPSIPLDSLIVVKKTEPSELEVGDVISFYSKDPSLDGAVNTHRIVAIEEDGGHYSFTTKGDANNVEDHYTTTESDLIGKVVLVSYRWGQAVRLLSNPLIFIPIIILPLVIILIMNLHQTISLARKIAREEQEQIVKEALEEMKRKKQNKS